MNETTKKPTRAPRGHKRIRYHAVLREDLLLALQEMAEKNGRSVNHELELILGANLLGEAENAD
jgi:hypothetical protein